MGAYLAAGFLVVLIGLSYAEVGVMHERTGGPLVYARETMGKTAGFTVGWMVWLTYLAGWAVLADGFVGYLWARSGGRRRVTALRSSSAWSWRCAC